MVKQTADGSDSTSSLWPNCAAENCKWSNCLHRLFPPAKKQNQHSHGSISQSSLTQDSTKSSLYRLGAWDQTRTQSAGYRALPNFPLLSWNQVNQKSSLLYGHEFHFPLGNAPSLVENPVEQCWVSCFLTDPGKKNLSKGNSTGFFTLNGINHGPFAFTQDLVRKLSMNKTWRRIFINNLE